MEYIKRFTNENGRHLVQKIMSWVSEKISEKFNATQINDMATVEQLFINFDSVQQANSKLRHKLQNSGLIISKLDHEREKDKVKAIFTGYKYDTNNNIFNDKLSWTMPMATKDVAGMMTSDFYNKLNGLPDNSTLTAKLNGKANTTDLDDYVKKSDYEALLQRVEALEEKAEQNKLIENGNGGASIVVNSETTEEGNADEAL